MMSKHPHTLPSNVPAGPVPGPRPAAPLNPQAPSTDLDVLETLAERPVAEHLAVFEELQASLTADLDSTSKDRP